MAWMIDLLRKLEKRTAMYTGGDSVGQLYAYLRGYRAALGFESNDAISRDDYEFIMGFQYWLALKVSSVESIGWADLVEKYFANDQIGSSASFYKLLNEYEKNKDSFGVLEEKYKEMVERARLEGCPE